MEANAISGFLGLVVIVSFFYVWWLYQNLASLERLWDRETYIKQSAITKLKELGWETIVQDFGPYTQVEFTKRRDISEPANHKVFRDWKSEPAVRFPRNTNDLIREEDSQVDNGIHL